jgi:hypothetical protein
MANIPQNNTAQSPSPSGKRTIYIRSNVWQRATEKAASLNLSTSQLLSQMIVETVNQIDSTALLGLQARNNSHRS